MQLDPGHTVSNFSRMISWMTFAGESAHAKCHRAVSAVLAGVIFGLLPNMPAHANGVTLKPFGDPDVAHRAPVRSYHVENYRLDLHFDESKKQIFGEELLTLEPLSAGFHRFYLDSSGLKIDAVSLQPNRPGNSPLRFRTEGSRLWIRLDHDYAPGSRLKVRITYHGAPRTGLYFVNPNRTYPDWPREVWSQGEPEFNQYWFPCWDYPNDMSTSEVVATVPAGQVAVSNGRLVSVARHGATTTFDWVESIPHSSYLTSIAVGPWKQITTGTGRLPVEEFVPRTVSIATARRSFRLTPDMIGFFSRALATPYPYEKYAQVVVKNDLFGGMENVSATTLSDLTLHTSRAEPQFSSQGVVSHELGQHWFGDLVQARDWADIWLNEGFATYMQALYTQYHDGNDAFRYEMLQDQRAAERQDRTDYLRPIVDDHYRYPLQMFDSITHEKGAVVLDMLRNILDGTAAAARPASQRELLFRALRTYLKRYRAQAVDTGELLRTIDDATHRRLGWFFHEWVFMAGSPHYRVTTRFDREKNAESITVTQLQTGNKVPHVFRMPVELAFYGAHGEAKTLVVKDSRREQHFELALGFKPEWVDFDPDDIIEKTLDFKQPEAALLLKIRHDPAAMSRLNAADRLAGMKGTAAATAVAALVQSLDHDPFYGVRVHAAAGLGRLHTSAARNALLDALKQPDSRVRVAVIHALGAFHGDRPVYAALVHAFHVDPNDAVRAEAAIGIGASGNPSGFEVLRAAASTHPDVHVMQGIFEGLAASNHPHAVKLLLDYARPGIAERLRIDALQSLSAMQHVNARDHATMDDVVQAALADPSLSTRFAAEGLAGAHHLTEFEGTIRKLAATAPTVFQREEARSVLAEIQH